MAHARPQAVREVFRNCGQMRTCHQLTFRPVTRGEGLLARPQGSDGCAARPCGTVFGPGVATTFRGMQVCTFVHRNFETSPCGLDVLHSGRQQTSSEPLFAIFSRIFEPLPLETAVHGTRHGVVRGLGQGTTALPIAVACTPCVSCFGQACHFRMGELQYPAPASDKPAVATAD